MRRIVVLSFLLLPSLISVALIFLGACGIGGKHKRQAEKRAEVEYEVIDKYEELGLILFYNKDTGILYMTGVNGVEKVLDKDGNVVKYIRKNEKGDISDAGGVAK